MFRADFYSSYHFLYTLLNTMAVLVSHLIAVSTGKNNLPHTTCSVTTRWNYGFKYCCVLHVNYNSQSLHNNFPILFTSIFQELEISCEKYYCINNLFGDFYTNTIFMAPPSVTGEVCCFPRRQLIFNFGRRVILYISFERSLRVHSEIDSVCLFVPWSSNE